jgi:hypothetical protein
MDLVNRSETSAQIFYTVAGEDRLLASVVLRRTFRIDGETLVPDAEDPFPVAEQAIKTEYGDFEPETPFAHEGFELFVLGKAYPHRSPAPRADFWIQIGTEFQRRIVAHGDRTWARRSDELVATAPLAFESLPMTLAFAYGGKAKTEVGDFAHPANPAGRGFYLTEEAAEGGLLPNLEAFDSPVSTWRDQPTPVGVTPLPRESSLRLERAIDYDADANPPVIRKIKPAYFNSAHPMMLLERAPSPGTLIRINGVRPGGRELRFRAPLDPHHVYVQLAERAYVFPAAVECMIALAEEERVVWGQRCCFRYRMVPRERRIAVLRAGAAPASAPPEYHIDWESFDAEQERGDA